MKTDLDHLPANKQRELERVKQIIFEEFEDALALATMNWKKKDGSTRSSCTAAIVAAVARESLRVIPPIHLNRSISVSFAKSFALSARRAK